MATVPGDPSNVTPMMPKWAQPTPADFLQAAAIMDGKGKFQVAGDVLRIPPTLEQAQRMNRLGRPDSGYEDADPNEVAKGVMQGKVKILKPEGK